jgi:hypothetical protein
MTRIAIQITALVAAACVVLPPSAKACPVEKTTNQRRDAQGTRFAIAGLVDIDNDGKSDIDLIRRIIERGGGTIDAEIHIDGKATGQLRRDTTYLILGKLPDKTEVSPMEAQRFDAFMRRVTELNIRVINVDGLLETGTRRTAPNLKGESIFRQRHPPLRRAGSEY